MAPDRSNGVAEDRACPLGFMVVATFASALVWLYALLAHLPGQ